MDKRPMRYDVTFSGGHWCSVNTPDRSGRFSTRKLAGREAARLNRKLIADKIGPSLTSQIKRLFR